ncbi:TorF family putative porin, partial [Escherichia coli]|nr:TorF family putative porin [Escherichia coli]
MQAKVSLHATVMGGVVFCAAALSSAAAFAQSTSQSADSAPAPAAASASPLTANVTLASQYRYRGLMQTNNKPAIQGGVDYALPNGFYVGNWNSSISWLGDSNSNVSAPIEMDFY